MRVERLALEGDPVAAAARLRELAPEPAGAAQAVRDIVADVRARGDAAVLEWTRRFDAPGAEALRVRAGRPEAALEGLDAGLRAALELAAVNVRDVAAAGVAPDRRLDLAQGQRIGLREVPVGRAAVYVPGGAAPYPSTVVMGAVTARVAGVEEVAVCSPPRPDGALDPAVLAACAICGVQEVYAMGGAQAVAALAYGTESVPAVDVVVGPGNLYVQLAKREVAGVVGIDGFAGPSELLVLLEDSADAGVAALDLRAQAEHGELSLVAAASPSGAALDALADALAELDDAPGAGAACALVEVADLEAALALAEALAPEHLQLAGAGAEALAPRVRRAGCVFVGAAAGTAFGDYVVGSNHVLPTGGAARFASSLSPRHFRRRMAEVRLTPGPGLDALAGTGAAIARAEGFQWHARSMEARMGENPRP